MISDRNFPAKKLEDFLIENDSAFTHPLSEVLKRTHTTMEEYAQKLASRGTIAYELDDATDNIKGVVIGYTHDLPEDGGSYITQAVTGINYRRQGVCMRLLQEFFSYCSQADIQYVWLTTNENNLGARTTYEKAGFVSVETDDNGNVKYVKKLD